MSKNKLILIFSGCIAVVLFSSMLTDLGQNNVIQENGVQASSFDHLNSCSSCHQDIVDHFNESNKAMAMFKPVEESIIERFDTSGFYHKPSYSYYNMKWEGDKMIFERFQKFRNGLKLNPIEIEVDWILGSGDDYRNYLYETDNGEIFQLPISWYSDPGIWEIAPGFNNQTHDGVRRKISGECIFCHGSYPDGIGLTEVGDQFSSFDLQEGISCERCHGDTKNHVDVALNSNSTDEQISSSILKISELGQQEKDDVCNQCHLQPTIAVNGQRRFGRGLFTYSPGELLTDYMVNVDITNIQKNGLRTFELNHSAYQLYQSKCYTEGTFKMTCTSCHDPHQKESPGEIINSASAFCLDCHEAHEIVGQLSEEVPKSECVTCHMPKRRPDDVVRVITTDHKIRVEQNRQELIEPKEEEEIFIQNVQSYNLPSIDSTSKVYLTVALLDVRKRTHILNYAKRLLSQNSSGGIHPYYYVAEAEMALGRADSALATIEIILNEMPDDPMAWEWKGIALMRLERFPEAHEALLRASVINPERAETSYHLGLYYYLTEDLENAERFFLKSLDIRGNMKISLYYLSLVHQDLGEFEEAERYAKEALVIDPMHTRSYLALNEALLAQDKEKEALGWLNHAYDIVPNELVIYRELSKLK